MNTYKLTIETQAPSREAAKSQVERAGFTVKRITEPATTTTVTSITEGVRASAALDMPAGLGHLERKAYIRGYGQACMSYVKKNGIPRGATLPELRKATVEAEWDRHPAAHRRAMKALATERDLAAMFEAARSEADDEAVAS